MLVLLRLTGIVGALSLENIVVVIVFRLILLEKRLGVLDGELALVVGGNDGVVNRSAIGLCPSPPPAPLVAAQVEFHLCVGHWLAAVGQRLAGNLHWLVAGEDRALVGERYGKGWGFILTHVDDVTACIVFFLSTGEVEREAAIHAVGGNLELALDAAIGIGSGFERVNVLPVGVAEDYPHLGVFYWTHVLGGHIVEDCGKLHCLAGAIDVEVGKHTNRLVGVMVVGSKTIGREAVAILVVALGGIECDAVVIRQVAGHEHTAVGTSDLRLKFLVLAVLLGSHCHVDSGTSYRSAIAHVDGEHLVVDALTARAEHCHVVHFDNLLAAQVVVVDDFLAVVAHKGPHNDVAAKGQRWKLHSLVGVERHFACCREVVGAEQLHVFGFDF